MQSTSSPSPSASVSPTSQASAAVLAITSAPFHAGEVGLGYGLLTLAATGGVVPYQWTVSAGALPGGLTLSSGGSVSGTPANAGNFHFSVQVADSAGGMTAASESVSIAPALRASLVPACAQHCSVEVGCVTVCGTFGTLSGGAGPFTYALQPGGYVPHGTTVSGLTVVGTFASVAQYWQFTVVVSDALGATTAITPTFYVYPHISLASGNCYGFYGTGCSAALKISGGAPGVTPSVKITSNVPNSPGCYNAGPPPAGYGLTVGGGYVTVSIPGNISQGYGAIWTLVLTDNSLCGPASYCSSAPSSLSIKVVCS